MKIRAYFIILCGLALFSAGFSPLAPLAPDILTVNTLVDEADGSCTDDDCSLRDAIYVVQSGATIDISVTGTISLDETLGEVRLAKNLMIRGPGVHLLTISGAGKSRVFNIDPGKTVTLMDLTVADGFADDGGGIYNRGILTLMHVTLYNNEATHAGGGIYNRYEYGRLDVKQASFIDNRAQYGAGLRNESAPAELANCTFTGNVAAERGGAMDNLRAPDKSIPTISIKNCTLSENTGGGMSNIDSKVTALNSIIAGNDGADCSGDFDSGSSFNLASDGTCFPGFFPASFESLKLDWDGWVYALLAGSVAVDLGTNTGCLSTDQLDQPRPVDGNGDGIKTCDIGAYERPAPALPVVRLFLPMTLKH